MNHRPLFAALGAWACALLFSAVVGCRSIDLHADPEPTGKEIYPSKNEQLKYDNFMLGRLKYIEPDADVDLVTAAFVDSVGNANEKLDEGEKELLRDFQERPKVYFTVGCPIYDAEKGREVGENGLAQGTPTNNPLDYMPSSDQPMWQQLRGCYLELEHALRFFSQEEAKKSEASKVWGVIEVDFTHLVYGDPAQVTRVWRFKGHTGEPLPLPLKCYRIKPEVCRLLQPDFRIIYLK